MPLIIFLTIFFGINFAYSQKATTKQEIRLDSLKKALLDIKLRPQNTARDTTCVHILTLLFEEVKMTNPKNALAYAQEALETAQKAKFEKGKARSLLALGVASNLLGNFEKALEYDEKALDIFTQNNDNEGIIDVVSNIGLIYSRRGDYPNSLKNHLKALQITENQLDTKRKALILENLAITYQLSGDLIAALKTYQEAQNLYIQNKNQAKVTKIFVNIGTIYNKQKCYPEATEAHKQALVGFEKENNLIGISIAYNNLGNVMLVQDKFLQAEGFYKKSLEIKEKLADKKGTSLTLRNLAEVYQKAKNFDLAKKTISKSLEIALQINAKEQIMDAYNVSADIFLDQKNFQDAYQFRQKAYIVKDSLLNVEKSKQITQMKELYETEKKEKENNALKQQLEKENLIKIGIIMLSMLVLAVFGLLVNRFRLQKQKVILALENEQIKIKQKTTDLENENILHKQDLEHKNRELTSNTLYILQKNEILEDLKEEIDIVLNDAHTIMPTKQKLKSMQKNVVNNLEKTQDWELFKVRFNEVYQGFFRHLESNHPTLTPKDLQLCAYLKLSFTTKEIANLLNNSARGVETSRYRLRKKLNLSEDNNLIEFLQKI